ncbi:hypothetical protein ACFLWR_04235 [Chloroflexota bacterium]
MLLDDSLPTYDISMRHSIRINASAKDIHRSVKELRFEEISPVVKILFDLRALPERQFKSSYPAIAAQNKDTGTLPFLEQLFSIGFVLLGDIPGSELVFGLIVPGEIGRFWKKSNSTLLKIMGADEFKEFNHPEYVKVVCNFLVSETDADGITRLSTESRIQALCSTAKKSFSAYWRVIHPGSALIRWFWLRAIKRRAEKS